MSDTSSRQIQLQVLEQAVADAMARHEALIGQFAELAHEDLDAPVPAGLIARINDAYAEVNSYMDQIQRIVDARMDEVILGDG